MILLVVGGFFRSLQFTAINTLAYAEVEPAQMSRATTLVSVNQQLAISAGVAVGAFSVESTMLCATCSELSAADFAPGLHRGRRSSRRSPPTSSTRCRRCRSSGLGTRRCRDPQSGARRRTGGDRRHRDRQRAGISGWGRRMMRRAASIARMRCFVMVLRVRLRSAPKSHRQHVALGGSPCGSRPV